MIADATINTMANGDEDRKSEKPPKRTMGVQSDQFLKLVERVAKKAPHVLTEYITEDCDKNIESGAKRKVAAWKRAKNSAEHALHLAGQPSAPMANRLPFKQPTTNGSLVPPPAVPLYTPRPTPVLPTAPQPVTVHTAPPVVPPPEDHVAHFFRANISGREIDKQISDSAVALLKELTDLDITKIGNFPFHKVICTEMNGEKHYTYLYSTAKIPYFRNGVLDMYLEFNASVNGNLVHHTDPRVRTLDDNPIIRSTKRRQGAEEEGYWVRALKLEEGESLYVRTYIYNKNDGRENPETICHFKVTVEGIFMLTENEYTVGLNKAAGRPTW